MVRIPIYTLRLLDISIPDDPDVIKLLLNGAKDLAKEHKKAFKKNGIKPDIFHNDDVKYSGIQLSRYQGAPEWTAIGAKEVKALKTWFKLFKKQSDIKLKNIVEVKEKYTPEYLKYRKKYHTGTLLISDDIAKELNNTEDKFAVYDRMEKYLYGNIIRFLKHIGFEHNTDKKFIKVTVINLQNHKKAKRVYHKHKKTAFAVTFTCNFRLPQTVRLGQSTALGYGKVRHIR